jgi:hypothetical protein
MTKEETISWIFLSIGIASKTEPTDYGGISQIADGINHAIPTHKEIQLSVNWLMKNNLIIKIKNKYSLSEDGKNIFNKVREESQTIMKIWQTLETEIINLNREIA